MIFVALWNEQFVTLATLLKRRDTGHSYAFCEIFKNNVFTEYPRVTTPILLKVCN